MGRLYANQGDWAQAKSAYQQALTIKPNDVQANVNYIQALWESNQRQFNPDIIQRLHQLLQQSPQQPDALAMLAMDAYQTKQYDKAIEYWQQLLKLVPAESEEAQALRQAIARASSTR